MTDARLHTDRTAAPGAWLRLVAVLLACACVTLPVRAQAVAVDAPSRNAQTRTQHDSLKVHRLRAPKTKPAGMATAGKGAARRKGGAAGTSAPTAPVRTPVPVRAGGTKPQR